MVKHLPPLAPLNYPQAKCIGEVFIHPHAVVASGVLLWAESGSRLEIAAGACIGMGTILHASHGTMLIATGASLGAGVLFMGSGEIGPQACVGAATTIINTSVPAGAVIPPGSLLGDTSRPVSIEETSGALEEHLKKGDLQPETSLNLSSVTADLDQKTPEVENQGLHTQAPLPEPDANQDADKTDKLETEVLESVGLVSELIEETTQTSTKKVYGQTYVNQMLQQMFNRPQN